jgi:hypothetical protein
LPALLDVTVEPPGAVQFEIHARQPTEKLKEPSRVDNFRIEIETPLELTEQHRAGVEGVAHHCLIHNTLLHRCILRK